MVARLQLVDEWLEVEYATQATIEYFNTNK